MTRTRVREAVFSCLWLLACIAGFCTFATAHADDAREAFVTNQLADTVSVVDLASMKQVSEIKVSGHPAGLPSRPTAKRSM